MIINKITKGYQTCSLYPNENWTEEDVYVVPDNTPLANKIIKLYPNYNFILTDNILTDVVETEPIIIPPTEDELNYNYENLTVTLIRAKYSQNDENKVLREYLSDMENESFKSNFITYNTYVNDCKTQSYSEIYGGE